jgi:DNA-binding SARP family transcriptional activator
MNEALDRSFTQFQESLEQSSLVLLHPESRLRSPLVARLLESSEYRIVYYALGPDDVSVESFIYGLTHQIAYQYPMFGRFLNLAGLGEPAEADGLFRAFREELRILADKPILFILDEYDRSDAADDVQEFVERLTHYLPEHCQIVINTRTLPRLPLISMMADRRALILGDEQVVMRDFYRKPREGGLEIEVYGLGPGFVIVNGRIIEDWEGHLPRLLFFFALDKPLITRSEICRSFWPDLDIDQAVNVFHVTKRRLHKALGVDFDVLLHNDGSYYLNPALNIDYDAAAFSEALLAARIASPDAAFDKWQRVVELYRGPFLQGHHEPWIYDRRRDYCAGFVEALSNMAELRIAADRLDHGLALLLRAVDADDTREDIHQRVMQLYAQLERRNEGIVHYQRMLESYQQRGVAPSHETDTIYQMLISA